MKKLNKPTDRYDDVFQACISNISDIALATNFRATSQAIFDAGDRFEELMLLKQLHTFPASDNVGAITKIQLNTLYTQKLAKLRQPGRAYYDKWKLIAPNGRCPLCGVREVKTLDHYLAKSEYPIFSIFPSNLIPACRDCNTEKLAQIASTYAEETLHPFYDDIDDERWLTASLAHTTPTNFSYQVVAPAAWDRDLEDRVNNHMTTFKLHRLYAVHAAEELSNINRQLKTTFQIGGANAVRDHLEEGYLSRLEANRNSWQTAMYEAMLQDNWFHDNCFF